MNPTNGGPTGQTTTQASPTGEAFSSSLRDMLAGMAMGSTPQESMSMAGRVMAVHGGQREQQQRVLAHQNQTLKFLTSKGVDPGTASYLATDPEAMRAWFSESQKGAKPQWKMGEIFDDQGRPQKIMYDERNPSRFNVIGGAKSDAITPDAEAQKIRISQASKPETHITVGGGKYGTIPEGYELKESPEGARLATIPGGPKDTSKQDHAKAESQATSTDIITGAAQHARDAVSSATLPTTGTAGAILSGISETGAAEVYRQVETIKANAKVENLQAMRASSPTGAGLGAVSDSENAMLAAKAGTLDPKSPNFLRDLDDYERSLLRTVHGKTAGDAIYAQTRKQSAPVAQNDPLGLR